MFQITFHGVAADADPAKLVESIYAAFSVYGTSEDAAAKEDGYVAALAAFSPYDVLSRVT